MDIYDLTAATARTVLSDFNSYPAADDTSGSSSAAATPPGLDLADVWQFVFRCPDLDRFKTTTFMPTDTVYGIGEGACYRVDKVGLNREGDARVLAIKYLKATEHPSRKVDDVESRRSIETVLRELRVLTHNLIRECENIVQLIGYGSHIVGEHISMYLVAEFAAHGMLKGCPGKKRKAGEKVSVVEKIKFCSGIANGLAALHASGIAQGNVKLENTLVCETDTGEIVAKLSDFGHSILDDESRYIGTTMFNAPAVRQGKSTSTLREDHYKFTLLQNVLESTLRDNAADRVTIREVMKFFNLEREFVATEKKKTTISSFGSSQLSTLERWSLYRADSLANTIPFLLQRRVFARLQSMVSTHTDPATLGKTLFELSMCYLHGFGVGADQEKILEYLREAESLKLPMAMGIFHRMHQFYSRDLSETLSHGHPMLEAEDQLIRLPTEKYFSARVRKHEALFQQSALQMPFDLYSDDVLIAKDLSFVQVDELQIIIQRRDITISSLVGRVPSLNSTQFGSLLHLAARIGSLSIVKLLVNAGADINIHCDGCGTPVTAACRGANSDIVQFLFRNGASAKRLGGKGPSPLHWMIMFEEDELEPMVKLLQDHSGDIDTFSKEARYYKLIEVLLKAGAATRGGILTPLDLAVSLGFPELTTLFLHFDPSSGMKGPLLHQGLSNGVQSLLQHGSQLRSQFQSTLDFVLKSTFSDINVSDNHGHTPLTNAIGDCTCETSLDQLEVLIDRGAELNISTEKVVNILAKRNDGRGGRIVKLLLSSGKIKALPMLLNQICLYGDEEILRALVECGDIDVNAPHIQENGAIGALHSSVMMPGGYDIMRTLLDHGADVNAMYQERYALELAIMAPIGDGDVIDLLVERGAELTSITETTILHLAARLASKVNGSHVLFHLLRHDRVPALINTPMDGKSPLTPIHYACICGDIEATTALVEAGAEICTVKELDLVAFVRVVGRCPELSPSSKNKDFDISRHRLQAERTFLMLLDQVDPGHRLTPLHVAAMLGNYERVVALVENGADVWAANAINQTPAGHICSGPTVN
ncbi:hypothetical protein VE02_09325 [Pseudogymnoascus sp. 03VT05]|nr:hypothetical protein VE02_09325 [Pseudogymnoascus sp. 03VT05]